MFKVRHVIDSTQVREIDRREFATLFEAAEAALALALRLYGRGVTIQVFDMSTKQPVLQIQT
jgi:hypothetical protein